MQVYHMSGAGNDFAVIDARGLEEDLSVLAKALCARLGADGFLAVDHAETADFRLHFYNPDGSRGEMCGNGARCVCKFAYDMGIAGSQMTVQTDAGTIYGQKLENGLYRVRLNNPGVLDLHRLDNCAYVELGTPGIPHAVTEVPGLTWDMAEALRGRGKALRYAAEFPKGANVSFYTVLGEGHVRVLTYERGVEDYTLACGTGCGSIAAALWTQGKLPGGRLVAENRGGRLMLTVDGKDGMIQALHLEGPAEVLKVYDI